MRQPGSRTGGFRETAPAPGRDAASSRESATTNAIVRLYGSASRRLAAQQRRSRRLRAFQNPECAPEIRRRGCKTGRRVGGKTRFEHEKQRKKRSLRRTTRSETGRRPWRGLRRLNRPIGFRVLKSSPRAPAALRAARFSIARSQLRRSSSGKRSDRCDEKAPRRAARRP